MLAHNHESKVQYNLGIVDDKFFGVALSSFFINSLSTISSMLDISNVCNSSLQSNENGKIAVLVIEQSEDIFVSLLFILETDLFELSFSKLGDNLFSLVEGTTLSDVVKWPSVFKFILVIDCIKSFIVTVVSRDNRVIKWLTPNNASARSWARTPHPGCRRGTTYLTRGWE
jgi:hypothetical protein